MDKQRWLQFAEVVDSLRIFPRLLLLSDFLFTSWYCWYALDVVVSLVTIDAIQDASTLNAITGGVIAATIPFITHRFSKVADIYLNTGRKWG